MAVLQDADRAEIWAELMREISNERESIGVVKADFRAAVNATDQWASDNAASFNSALPQPFRGAASVGLKARLLSAVLRRRYTKGV